MEINVHDEPKQKMPKMSLRSFVQDVKSEMQQVAWTPSRELKKGTKAVIGSIFFFGLSIYAVDLVTKSVLQMFRWAFDALFS